MFTWNYRIVNTKSLNAGEDWYCLQEVCYDKKLPPLQEEDFTKRATK